MLTSEFYYNLPENLIAERPLENRSDSKLLVLHKDSGKIEHKRFFNIIDFFNKDDCLVLNNTKVIPARLNGYFENTNKKIEILLISKIYNNVKIWEVITKNSKKIISNSRIIFDNGNLSGKVKDKSKDGKIIIEFDCNGEFNEVLEKIGSMPLPPYILKKRKENWDSPQKKGLSQFYSDKERYQTIYAKKDGSIAAPTAGLHFTNEIISLLKERGVKITEITLHIGIGTFKPIRVNNIEEHNMDKEYFEISDETINIINETKKSGKKVIGVGTSVVRTLEYVYSNNGSIAFSGKRLINQATTYTDIFIYSGFKFNIIDSLITNFHLPFSTPLLLVCAFANKNLILKAYKSAIDNNYRFYSYGDAMMII